MFDFRDIFDELFGKYASYDTHVEVTPLVDDDVVTAFIYSFTTTDHVYMVVIQKAESTVIDSMSTVTAYVRRHDETEDYNELIHNGWETRATYETMFNLILAYEMKSLWHPSRGRIAPALDRIDAITAQPGNAHRDADQ